MTDTTQPADAGLEAQVMPDATEGNPIAETAIEENTDASEGAEPKASSDEDVPFPKKAVNALSRRDKQIGKLRAEKYQVLNELEQLRQQLGQNHQAPTNNTSNSPDPDAPDINQFQNYDDYNRAVARHEARKAYAEENQKAQKNQSESSKRAWQEERDSYIDDNAVKLKETFSDTDHVMQENIDILQSFAPHVVDAIREADNGAFALYQLAKDGALEQLNGMSQAKVAMLLARAEDKALANAKNKPATKAPAPLQGVKGTAPNRPPLLDKLGNDSDKILSWLKSK